MEAKQREASGQAAQQQQDLAYARTLVLRYMELEDQHEALFPAIATYFKFTQAEVARLRAAQRRHEQENSLWGRAASAGSFLIGAAVASVEVVKEVRAEAAAGAAAPAPATASGSSAAPRR